MNYSLYLVADIAFCQQYDLFLQTVDAGVTCVQLRDKKAAKKDMVTVGKKIRSLLRMRHIPLIINDHVDLLEEVDAEGVHIGQRDMNFFAVRKKIGNNKIIGLSIENLFQAKQCRDWSVDYFGVGPIFKTITKQDATEPIGIPALKKIRQVLTKPLIAIGGIQYTNVGDLIACGVDGVAVVSAITCAADPVRVVKTWCEKIKNEKTK